MEAETLNCPMCGASAATDAPECQFCGSRLATVACSGCFAMMFLGSKHCQRCGAAAAVRVDSELEARACPRCKVDMEAVTIGSTKVRECHHCAGLWLDVSSFEKVCADREEQSAVLGTPSLAGAPHTANETAAKITYAPCPECAQLMNRINFARCSGVIVDICKRHGIWFDRDELSRIIEFIRGGGMEVSRVREKAEIEEERRRLRQERLAADMRHSGRSGMNDSEDSLSGIASARELLKLFID